MKKINILVYAILAAFGLSLLFLLFSAAYTSVENISVQNLEERTADLERREVEFSKLENSGKEWRNIETIYSRFKGDYLMKFNEFSEFRSDLETIFRQNSLYSSKKSYRIANIFDGFVKVSIAFNVTGGYRNIKKFIFNIENDKRMIFFRSVHLNKTQSGISGQFSLEAYFVR